MNRQGIDVSHWQGSIDWQAARTTLGYAFCKASQGSGSLDSTFTKARVAALRKAKIPFGPYHYADNSGSDGAAEAEFFVRNAKAQGWGKKGDLPGALDIESGTGGKTGVRFVRRFAKRYKELTGHRCIVYTGFFWRDALGNPITLTRCPLWLAAYTSAWQKYLPRAWKKPTIHQYTDSFSCPGVSGPCDGDKFLMSEATFEGLRLKENLK